MAGFRASGLNHPVPLHERKLISKISFREVGCVDGGVDGTGFGLCPVTGSDMSCAELLTSVTRE
jgi:hypothetical protein